MSDPLAVRLRSEHATVTEQLQAAQLIDSLVEENGELIAVLERIARLPGTPSDELATAVLMAQSALAHYQ